MRGFRFRSMAWPLVYSAFGRRRVGLRQTWLIWFRRSTRENKRFCAIEGEEPLVDFVTREQDVWSRQFYSHDGQNILSQPNKNASNHFLRKSSYSLWQKRIPSRPPPPPLPAPVLPGPADSAVVHISTNSRILPGANLSTLDSFFIATTIFFSLSRDNSFFFFSYPKIVSTPIKKSVALTLSSPLSPRVWSNKFTTK